MQDRLRWVASQKKFRHFGAYRRNATRTCCPDRKVHAMLYAGGAVPADCCVSPAVVSESIMIIWRWFKIWCL